VPPPSLQQAIPIRDGERSLAGRAIIHMSRTAVCRRRFLLLATNAAALGACSSTPGVPPIDFGNLAAGTASSLHVGSLLVVGAEPVCIGRDPGGIYAMTLTCPHSGCDIGQTGNVSPQGLLCGCHGSTFDANGNVLSGPAPAPLDHFAVTADGSGNLTIHGGQVVAQSQRLKG
jgi:nitrite reductase/ring-hydroxylating ferredoxin subunit